MEIGYCIYGKQEQIYRLFFSSQINKYVCIVLHIILRLLVGLARLKILI